jgi:uncharacterized membrane protein
MAEEKKEESKGPKFNIIIAFLASIQWDATSIIVYVLLFVVGYVYRKHTRPYRPEMNPIEFILDIDGTGHVDKHMVDESIELLIKGFEKDVLKIDEKEANLKFKRHLWMFVALLALCFEGAMIYVSAGEAGTKRCAIVLICFIPFLWCFEHVHAEHNKIGHFEEVKRHLQIAEERAEKELKEDGYGKA